MAWIHDTGYAPAYTHAGYPVSVLADGSDTGTMSARVAAQVVGWRAAMAVDGAEGGPRLDAGRRQPAAPRPHRAGCRVTAVEEASGSSLGFLVRLGSVQDEAKAVVVLADVLDVERHELAAAQGASEPELPFRRRIPAHIARTSASAVGAWNPATW